VLSLAAGEMSTTRELISQNNPAAEAWAQQVSVQIDSLAAQKRQELMAFYS
jgi:hypothetical protein